MRLGRVPVADRLSDTLAFPCPVPRVAQPPRLGLSIRDLSDAQFALFESLLKATIGTATGLGYDEVQQHLNADDYLADNGGGDDYGRSQFFVAFLGVPQDTGTWEFQFGGHHLAVANTYIDGSLAGATPSFRGIEPNGDFEWDGATNHPMAEKEAAFTAAFSSLTSEQQATAKLSDVNSDLVPGPGDDWAFPPTKEGLQVSSLSADQKSLVLAAIASYVDDIADADATTILANTAGALLGTVLAPVLVLLTGRRSERDAGQPRPVTLRRRLFGMLCDALVLTLVSGALASVTALGLALLEPGVPPGLSPLVLGVLAFVAPALQLVLVLRTGRTIGEAVVRLTPSTTPVLWQRLVRWALGSGGWAAALASPLPGSGTGATLLVLAALVGVLATRDRRGFASAVARLRVIDDRAAPAEDAVDAIDSP